MKDTQEYKEFENDILSYKFYLIFLGFLFCLNMVQCYVIACNQSMQLNLCNNNYTDTE